jgi:hypothetical protein
LFGAFVGEYVHPNGCVKGFVDFGIGFIIFFKPFVSFGIFFGVFYEGFVGAPGWLISPAFFKFVLEFFHVLHEGFFGVLL